MSDRTTFLQSHLRAAAAPDPMELLDIKTHMRQFRMDKHSAPEWYEALQKLSAKAGTRTPALYRVPIDMTNGASLLDAIIITDGMIKTSGSSIKGSPSKEAIAMIAHELGHFKHGGRLAVGIRLMPFMMPMAVMAALYIYENTIKIHKDINLENIEAAIGNTTNHLLEQLHLRKPDSSQTKHEHDLQTAWKEQLLNAGRYMLAGALGLGAGLAATRSAMRGLEFYADRTVVHLTGEKEPWISMLRKMHSEIDNIPKVLSASKANMTIERKVKKFANKQLNHFITDILHAHPSLAEREAHLNRTYQTIVTESRAAAPPHLAL